MTFLQFQSWLKWVTLWSGNFISKYPNQTLNCIIGFLLLMVIVGSVGFALAILESTKRQKIKEADPEFAEFKRLCEKFGKM